MNRNIFKTLAFSLSAVALLTACSTDGPGGIDSDTESKYVLMTVSDRTQQNGGGYITTFDEIPSGTISNVTENSLRANRGLAGWRTYENWIFKMFRSEDATTGIEKLEIGSNGKASIVDFLAPKNPTEAGRFNGTGNFAIVNSTSGFYWDASEPLHIQTFNPTDLSNTSSLDFSDVVNQLGADEVGINFRAIGQKFLAVKDGKLYANLTYGKLATGQAGFFDDFYPDVYIAVIDIATQKHEKTIKIENTGSIAYINDNAMYHIDRKGDLYIVCQGRSALGTNSKIARIKANESDIDSSWELKFSDFRSADDGKFVGVYSSGDELILTVNTVALTPGPTGNINSADIWKFYSVDIASKSFTAIEGVPVSSNAGAALAVTEVDDMILLRGSTVNESANGYYQYNSQTKSATKLFEVNEGGAVSGFAKIEVR